MFHYPSVIQTDLVTDINPCNPSTLLFQCHNAVIYSALIIKIIVCLPFFYLMIKYFRQNRRLENELMKMQISFCATALVFLTFYYFLEFIPTYASSFLHTTQV